MIFCVCFAIFDLHLIFHVLWNVAQSFHPSVLIIILTSHRCGLTVLRLTCPVHISTLHAELIWDTQLSTLLSFVRSVSLSHRDSQAIRLWHHVSLVGSVTEQQLSLWQRSSSVLLLVFKCTRCLEQCALNNAARERAGEMLSSQLQMWGVSMVKEALVTTFFMHFALYSYMQYICIA